MHDRLSVMKRPITTAGAAKRVFATRLNEALIERLKLKAVRERRPVQDIVADALAFYLKEAR